MKLININIGIKLNNANKITEFLKKQNADIVAIQEIVRHLEDSVFEEFKSKQVIENSIEINYPYKFFGPLWVTNKVIMDGKTARDFGGLIEQGNEIMSKYKITDATLENEEDLTSGISISPYDKASGINQFVASIGGNKSLRDRLEVFIYIKYQ